ncbi:uncharacterized protein LACBIDRAFT_320838 [Laccaria bicolor S238N-H82]|uniref:Predicted protein n=1 Tax=Laccaria bicolor (strain S238N-H82 / ATCC MYA-4686) TaxID=486041 RepID=B0CRF4_LACBS|nr:uncharacterized protein LACBIDRAFT_320838 [Laccaria bicolor S238N-H82]EDR15192.1 predicted protein [Laccaria bicolor S238N-H82]|eukprot:XP_001873400.1 predicted protein [Laccaria bicolor S238N-H82]
MAEKPTIELDADAAHTKRSERQLGDTEVSYFLPSRQSGVNDMYLHLGCRASASILQRERVCLIWAILRLRHPLLASRVEMLDYEDIRFVYEAPPSPKHALEDADKNLAYRTQSAEVQNTSDIAKSADATQNYDFLICATHFLGDGMALHRFANDFFGMLGGLLSEQQLTVILEDECKRCYETLNEAALPESIESRLPSSPGGKFYHAASLVDFQIGQHKLTGGHSFPRRSAKERRTIVPTVSFDPARTKYILSKCKSRGVSISSALFAVCNVAWAKTYGQNWQLPMMMYSALNMRPFLQSNKALNDSYWYIAIGYFNIVLPTFLPRSGDVTPTFWLRARSAKDQSTRAVKNPMIIPRSRRMAEERGSRARQWAREDDGVKALPPRNVAPTIIRGFDKSPSSALMGLSLLGNLDGIYKHPNFPDIKLHTLTTGSRQRSGGMLLFGYTFASKLWISFGYDENGFEEFTVQEFWKNVLLSVDEFLLV